MRGGEVNVRTAYIPSREELPEAISQITSYFADYIGSGKCISWAQGWHPVGRAQVDHSGDTRHSARALGIQLISDGRTVPDVTVDIQGCLASIHLRR
jgi:hypothetical protein